MLLLLQKKQHLHGTWRSFTNREEYNFLSYIFLSYIFFRTFFSHSVVSPHRGVPIARGSHLSKKKRNMFSASFFRYQEAKSSGVPWQSVFSTSLVQLALLSASRRPVLFEDTILGVRLRIIFSRMLKFLRYVDVDFAKERRRTIKHLMENARKKRMDRKTKKEKI